MPTREGMVFKYIISHYPDHNVKTLHSIKTEGDISAKRWLNDVWCRYGTQTVADGFYNNGAYCQRNKLLHNAEQALFNKSHLFLISGTIYSYDFLSSSTTSFYWKLMMKKTFAVFGNIIGYANMLPTYHKK